MLILRGEERFAVMHKRVGVAPRERALMTRLRREKEGKVPEESEGKETRKSRNSRVHDKAVSSIQSIDRL
jgi:hypothetical protein